MSLTALKRKHKDGAKVLGIDCSTHSLAFAIFEKDKAIRCGEIKFVGSTLFERLSDAHDKVPALMRAGILEFDYVAMEAAVAVGNNVKTAISLAYVYGAVMGGLMASGIKVVTVTPMQWQSYIGNGTLKKNEKDAIKRNNPGKSESWYKAEYRRFRKQRTLEFAKQHFPLMTNAGNAVFQADSDNVGDAIGIAWYAANNPTA